MSEDKSVYGEGLTLDEYLRTPETTRHRELMCGVVREPAAPRWGHQVLVGRLFTRLERHVTRRGLGSVATSPLDVVLSAPDKLVLQPDIVVITADRRDIIRDGRVWGAPDLVVEVVSLWTASYDRGQKREWYRQFGVREAWLLDPVGQSVEVCDFAAGPSRHFGVGETIASRVLPRLRLRVETLFAEEA